METNKTEVLSAILEAILSDKRLSVENVNNFLKEGKNALENLLKIKKEEAQELLYAFNECQTKVEEWKKKLNDEEVKGKFKEEECILDEKDTPTGYQLFKHKKRIMTI